MIKYSIEAWIYNPIAKEILLLKVKTGQLSFWQPITGGIKSDESSEAACLREIKEETGLALACSNLTGHGDFTVKIDKNLTIHKNLFLVLTEQKDIQISDEHVGAQWVALNKVSSQLYWPSNQATFEIITEKL
ncbi:NUDIX hydrolase [Streptococcus intermedius]|uniref:NUDIX hydrolase n=1 Tax=Streptococcus intermedius TaxID=1338 RepID=UPI00124D326B|nr:NUDIX domain-containing protein [Streptococcus intermedius]